jgi:nucleotide-binding universal stress UspA family protein
VRVLFASDGSRAADRARDLLARLPWPDGTRFCVASATRPREELFGAPWPMPSAQELDSIESELLRHAEVTLDDAERALEGHGRMIDRITLRGRAASAIVEEARAWKADLIVLGSRGHGPIAAMLLGSTSAEVVDHAPCAVLIVRDPEIASVIVADDGSEGAARAAAAVRDWPIFRGLPVDVVSVAETRIPWSAGMPAGLYDEVMASYAEDVEAARKDTDAVAHRTAAALQTAGIPAVPHLLEGDPAHELVQFAAAHPHSLTVLGTRGHGGLVRLVLGSVARNVLLHAPGSVLVMRETAGAPQGTEDREAVGTSA